MLEISRRYSLRGKLLSVFEPSTEIICEGKAGSPNEFGKMVKLQEAENQIVIDFEVFAPRGKWRTGCEVRISVSKRRHGLDRCRYKDEDGMKRRVGLGMISDNLVNIGRGINEKSSN